jgi:FlaG/FlaF family flagellin (archaellin)
MSWESILKKTETNSSAKLIDRLEKEVERFLNRHLFEKTDYNQKKINEMQKEINDGSALDGLGKELDIHIFGDPARFDQNEFEKGLYVGVRDRNYNTAGFVSDKRNYITYFHMDIHGNFEREKDYSKQGRPTNMRKR